MKSAIATKNSTQGFTITTKKNPILKTHTQHGLKFFY